MNGFDKAVEAIYTVDNTAVTDATDTRGVQLLRSSLPAIHDEETSEAALSTMLDGIVLAQYGLSTPTAYRASIIHAFGHALSRNCEIQ